MKKRFDKLLNIVYTIRVVRLKPKERKLEKW